MQSQISSEVHWMSSLCVLMLKLYIIIFYSNSTQLNIICTIWGRTSADYNNVFSANLSLKQINMKAVGEQTRMNGEPGLTRQTDWRWQTCGVFRLWLTDQEPRLKGGEGVRRESCLGQLRKGGGGLQGVTCFIDVCPLFLWREKWTKY